MEDRAVKRIVVIILVASALCAFISGCADISTQQIDTTPAPTSTPEPTTDPSYWYVRRFVDEFGDETDSTYVQSTKITGSFSNTATSNSSLSVYVSFEESDYKGDFISFRLLEYGKHKATHLSSERIELMFKIEDGSASNTYYMTLTGSSDISSDVYTWEELNDYDVDDFHVIIDALKSGKSFPCRIDIGTSSEYHFILDGTGFADAVQEMELTNQNQGGK